MSKRVFRYIVSSIVAGFVFILAIITIEGNDFFVGLSGRAIRFILAAILLAFAAFVVRPRWSSRPWRWVVTVVALLAAVVLVANVAPEQSVLVRDAALSAVAAVLITLAIAVAEG